MPFQRRSIRLKEYNYADSGAYFITLVTWKRVNLFGEITAGEMQLNNFGEIVEREWLRTGEIRREINLDEFILMPNHFHGIVVIQNDLRVYSAGDRPVAPTGGERHQKLLYGKGIFMSALSETKESSMLYGSIFKIIRSTGNLIPNFNDKTVEGRIRR